MPASPPSAAADAIVLVVMGVSGSGKTTVATRVAQRLGWAFEEGDALHPPSNVEKMHAGHPLTDDDRAPWLARVAAWVDARLDAGAGGIITCSALKRRYRDAIAHGRAGVLFVFLDGTHDTVAHRLAARRGHFMPANLLDSQFDALERPSADEPVLSIDVGAEPDAVAQAVIDALIRAGRIPPSAARLPSAPEQALPLAAPLSDRPAGM